MLIDIFACCLQYLAAVRLIGESSKRSRVKGAQLTRYAAALLGMEERHRMALVQSAATRNMEVNNYGCAFVSFRHVLLSTG